MPCMRCQARPSSYGLPQSPRMWCRPCANVEWVVRDTPEEDRVDSHRRCLRCQVMRPSYGLHQAPRMWCRVCANVEWEERQTPAQERRSSRHG
jgi:hypothetical protein